MRALSAEHASHISVSTRGLENWGFLEPPPVSSALRLHHPSDPSLIRDPQALFIRSSQTTGKTFPLKPTLMSPHLCGMSLPAPQPMPGLCYRLCALPSLASLCPISRCALLGHCLAGKPKGPCFPPEASAEFSTETCGTRQCLEPSFMAEGGARGRALACHVGGSEFKPPHCQINNKPPPSSLWCVNCSSRCCVKMPAEATCRVIWLMVSEGMVQHSGQTVAAFYRVS